MVRPSASSIRRAASIALTMVASAVSAAPAAEDDIAHTIQPGDTLEQLATHYFGNARLWVQLQAHNQVRDPRHLRPGSVLRIPAHLQPLESASVDFAQGDVTVIPADGTRPTAPLQVGQQLEEGSRLQVGPDAFVTVRLADGSVIRVQSQSDVQLRQLRRRGRAGSVQSVLEMHSGSLESSVSDRKEATRRFEIRTPMATTSVRGTEFSVRLADTGQATASVTEGSVAVQSRAGHTDTAPALLAPGQGLAITADGRLGTTRSLLPAPDLTALPATLHEADILALTLPDIPNATGYQVQMARDPRFTQVVRSGTFATAQARLRGVDDGAYYLSVRGLDDAGIPGYAAQRPVTVKTQPIAPLYQQPAPGATISRTTGQLLCTQVSGVRWYRIQIASDTSFTRPLWDESRLQECRSGVSAVEPGAYFWRAASIRELAGGQPDEGPFGPSQAVSIADSPQALDLSAMQTSDGEPGAQLRWHGQSGQTFRLQLAAQMDFSATVLDTELAEPAWSSTDLAPGNYYVRIQTKDPSGLQSGFSTPRQIKVGAPIQTSAGLPVTSGDGQPLSRP